VNSLAQTGVTEAEAAELLTKLSLGWLRLLIAAGIWWQTQRAIVWGALTLTCIGLIAAGPETMGVGTPAEAQTTPSMVSPPNDAPVMRLGERVLKGFGWIEISSFTRSKKDKDTEFKVEYIVFNNIDKTINIDLMDFFRLIADDMPRAPSGVSGSNNTGAVIFVAKESAEYGDVTFTVRGQPRVTYVQFGTGDAGRSFLRWPD
jgi:hypothetical protein